MSQAFIAEIVNEEVYEEVVEETSIKELAVVAEVFGEELDSGNVAENEDPSNVESVEKSTKQKMEKRENALNSTSPQLKCSNLRMQKLKGWKKTP